MRSTVAVWAVVGALIVLTVVRQVV